MATKSKKTVTAKSSKRPAKTTKKPAGTAQPEAVAAPVRLPSVWVLSRSVWRMLAGAPRLFIGITVIYVLLSLLLVGGVTAGLDTQTMKDAINAQEGKLAGSLGVFAVLLSSANGGRAAGGYQLIIMVICSLATLWVLRHVIAGSGAVRIRDAFYQGMYPLVPVILVLLVIAVQLVPLLIGLSLITTVLVGGMIHLIEKVLLFVLGVALSWLSLYLLTASVFALYIVALPDMTPRRALRSASQLARGRRWVLVRKLLFLPIVLIVIYGLIVVPILLTITAAAPWVLYILLLLTLPVVHTYLYTLYRELLQ